MIQIDEDIRRTQDVHNIIYTPEYGKIYFKSNEFLNELFKNVDLKDKNVLTVVGSGDQSFLCYENGAKSVDLFDINKLAIYYYYIRIWVIENFNTYYPDQNLDKNYIKELLKYVNPKTEEEMQAYLYWSRYVNTYFIKNGSLFFKSSFMNDIDIDGLKTIKERLKTRSFTTYNLDISKPWNHDKKYDVIIVSNISDYVLRDNHSFCVYRDNLDNLLEDNGIIVCSRIHSSCSFEKETFRDKFIRKSFPRILGWEGKMESTGYSYRKRK